MLSFSWMLELETGVWAEGTTIVVSSSNDPGNMRRSALILRFCLEEFRANPNPSMHAGVSWSNCRYCAELHHAGGLILIGAAGQKMLPRGRGWWCGTAWPWGWLTSTLYCRMLKLRGGGWSVGHLGGTPILLALKRERPLWGVSPSAMKYASEIMEKLKAPVLLCSFAFHF